MNIESTSKVELRVSKAELLSALRLLYPDEFLLERLEKARPENLKMDLLGDSITLTGTSAITTAQLDVRRRGGAHA
jgi:hypothetical protein